MALVMARSRAEPWALRIAPLKPSNGAPPIDFRVHAPADGAKGILGQQRSEPSPRVGHKFPLEHREESQRQTLAGLEHDVAHKTIADHHIHMILEKVMSLDVTDEIQVEPPTEFKGFQRQIVALGLLGADAQDTHPRILAANDLTGNKRSPSQRNAPDAAAWIQYWLPHRAAQTGGPALE